MDPFSSYDLSPRLEERYGIVLKALNMTFGWNLPNDGAVHPGAIIGGHANVPFMYSGDLASYRKVIDEPGDTFWPPGHRIPLRLPDDDGIYTLHIPQAVCKGGVLNAYAHIDRGDPDRDVCGLITHVGYDFLWSHLFRQKDLDPKRF